MKRLVLLGVALLALGGCYTRTSGIIVDNGKIIVNEWRIANKIEYVGEITAKTELGFSRAQVEIVNKKRYDYRFQYKFTWFDADGLVIDETANVWKTDLVHGLDSAWLEAVCESPRAAKYRISIRKYIED